MLPSDIINSDHLFLSILQASCERLFWLLILLIIIPKLCLEIKDVFNLSAEREIVTIVGLRPISEVPFPSVIIDNGRPQDPMGYIKYSKDNVTEDDAEGPGKNLAVSIITELKVGTEADVYLQYYG